MSYAFNIYCKYVLEPDGSANSDAENHEKNPAQYKSLIARYMVYSFIICLAQFLIVLRIMFEW